MTTLPLARIDVEANTIIPLRERAGRIQYLTDIDTRFAIPIICPTTGETVSAETLYNRCCDALGHQLRDHIGDLILDNLNYDSLQHPFDDTDLCAAVFCMGIRRAG